MKHNLSDPYSPPNNEAELIDRYNGGERNFPETSISHANLAGAQLPGIVLEGACFFLGDFSGANLEGANLAGIELEGGSLLKANLKGANLKKGGLSSADCRWADFSEADLSHSNLTETNLSGADLTQANLEGAELEEANLTKAILQGAKLRKTNLGCVDLRGATFTDAELKEAVFRGATLRGVDLRGSDLSSANFHHANLYDANLRGANLSGADLTEANLTMASLAEANLQTANLTEAKLKNAGLRAANFTRATLKSADLEGANLQQANLYAADCWGASFKSANLQEAQCNYASFEETNLTDANCQRADFVNTFFRGARLKNTDLRYSKTQLDSFVTARVENANLEGVTVEDSSVKRHPPIVLKKKIPFQQLKKKAQANNTPKPPLSGARMNIPTQGQLVRVRSRQYLVEEVSSPPSPEEATLVRLSCLDDDAQGEPLDVLWEHELDAEVVSASWDTLGKRPFDPPNLFAAFLHTLRWSCVTATNPRLFQAPWRAGIEVMSYQLEPLRKALLLPRVNLFIADDVGLGKTIEAGLVLRELLMRQKVRRVVIVAPPSVVIQWREEMEQRFGLTFRIYDREFVSRCRRERGYSVNPWTTHTRFIISQALLRDEEYASPMRDWLGIFAPNSLLILDEAHHAAPASSSRYAIDSQFTRAVRDLAPRFEHRLFLSATPHNGLSNSFSALMELLDPQRFCRGVKIDPKLRDAVMVRRLKSDLVGTISNLPKREVRQITLSNLPADNPELKLAALLDRYWELREQRLESLSSSARAAQGLVLINLQKRLLSSIEAFARTLNAHRRAIEKLKQGNVAPLEAAWDNLPSDEFDDSRADLPEDEVEAEEEQTTSDASLATGAAPPSTEELSLLEQMATLAESSRRQPDARIRWFSDWLMKTLCPDGKWQPKRVVLFTEYADTKRYLEQQLNAIISNTERAEERIKTFHGGMPDDLREEIKRAFNTDPNKHPLRILIATDAAREGVNLQNYCADLFHFDLPWNPSRLEQRNGRIDRKLQREPIVRCRYFVYAARAADRVLEVLAQRTETIQKELGCLPPVLEAAMTRALSRGIGPRRRQELFEQLQKTALPKKSEADSDGAAVVIEEELEGSRERKEALGKQLDALRDILADSRKHLDLNEDQLRQSLSCSLQLMGAEPLQVVNPETQDSFRVPELDKRPGADPTWAETMDTLRAPKPRDLKLWDWRRSYKPRPVIFRDPGHINEDQVHLHLEHRLVQRLLGRFLAQGFLLDDLSRACVGQSDDAAPRVLLLGRLSLYGEGAARLHDEIVSVAARWLEPERRKEALKPYAEANQEKTWELLLQSLKSPRATDVPEERKKILLLSAQRDMQELLPHLTEESERLAASAAKKLTERGQREAKEMTEILSSQKKRIEREQSNLNTRLEAQQMALFKDEEVTQLKDDARYWVERLKSLEVELKEEPVRIQRGYEVRARRIEPVGIAYLWPVSG